MGIKTGVVGVVSVTDAATVEAKASTNALARRHTLIVHNSSTSDTLFYGYANTVASTTGMPIAVGASMIFDFEPASYVPVYLAVASGATVSAVIEECA